MDHINHISYYELKGKVQNIKESTKYDSRVHACWPHVSFFLEFNIDGQLTKNSSYDTGLLDGVSYSSIYIYNADKKLVKIKKVYKKFQFNLEDEITTEETYFDEKERVMKELILIDNRKTSETKFEYHQNDQVARSIRNYSVYYELQNHFNLLKSKYRTTKEIDKKLRLVFNKKIITYDKRANKISETIFSSNGKLSSKKSFIYNELDMMIEEAKYNKEGKLSTKETFLYNSANELEEVIYFYYDNEGKFIREEHKSIEIKTNNFDDKDKFINETPEQDNEAELHKEFFKERYSYLYEYDEIGNWITKRAIKKIGVKTVISKKYKARTIKYY